MKTRQPIGQTKGEYKECQVRFKDFMAAWLDRHGRSPREIVHRLKIREILAVNKWTR